MGCGERGNEDAKNSGLIDCNTFEYFVKVI
jgi:hypothetical protein